MAVGLTLVQVAKKFIESHTAGDPVLIVQTQSPFTKQSGLIAGLLQHHGHCEIAFPEGFPVVLIRISPDPGVPRV